MVVGENEGELGESLIEGSSGMEVGVEMIGEEKESVRFVGGCCLCPRMVIGEKEGELGENVGELGENVIGDGVGVEVGVDVDDGVTGVAMCVVGGVTHRIGVGGRTLAVVEVGFDVVDWVSGDIVEGVGGADEDDVR